jgi:hypothetical protein
LTVTAHTFDVRATDPAGNTDASAARRSFTIDLTPPAAPTITGIEPASPADDNHPRVKGTADPNSTVRLHATTCSSPPVGTGSAADFASVGVQASVPDNSTTTLHATAVDPAGNISGCSTTFVTYVEVSSDPPAPGGVFAPPGSASVIADTTGPVMSVGGKVLKIDSRGTVSASLSCPASEPGGCEGSLLLETLGKVRASGAARKLKLGSARFRLAGGQNARVKIRLSRRSKRLVKRLRRVRVVALVTAQDAAGNRTTARKILTLRAAGTRRR